MSHPRRVPPRAAFECTIPILRVENLGASLNYYVDVLGFAKEWEAPPMVGLSRDGKPIYLCEGDQGQPATWVWIGVSDVDVLREEYRTSGARVTMEPTNYLWALEMRVADLDGHVLRFGSDPREADP